VLADAGEDGERVVTGEGFWFGPVIDTDDRAQDQDAQCADAAADMIVAKLMVGRAIVR
jgi:hypothetical protein